MGDSDGGNEGMSPPPKPDAMPASATTSNPRDANLLATPANGSRALMLLALLFFLLPWVTVSCADQTLVSMSGLDLARGSVTMHNPMTGETAQPPDGGEPDMPVLIGGILVGLALALSFAMKGRNGTLASMASLAAAAALISYTVLIRIPDRAREDAARQGRAAPGAPDIDQAQIAEMVRVETQAGFWLTLAAIIGAIALAWIVARREAPPG